jgi:hypothetical protein
LIIEWYHILNPKCQVNIVFDGYVFKIHCLSGNKKRKADIAGDIFTMPPYSAYPEDKCRKKSNKPDISWLHNQEKIDIRILIGSIHGQ